jgi:hypothetical protein
MVGGAILVGDARGPHAQRGRERSRGGERARSRPVDRAAGAREHRGIGAGGHGHQRMQRERLVRRQHVEPRGARAVADHWAACERRRRIGDLAVGDAQQDGRGVVHVSAPAERSEYVMSARGERGGKGGTESARTDDGDQVQFPHGDTGFYLPDEV